MSFRELKKDLKAGVAADIRELTSYKFGPFQITPSERRLSREGEPVPITAKAFDTLLFLIQRNGHLVEKSTIMESVWPDSFVEELEVVLGQIPDCVAFPVANHDRDHYKIHIRSKPGDISRHLLFLCVSHAAARRA